MWALSLHIISQLVKDVEDLSDNPFETDVVLHHKENGMSRMKNDGADGLKIRHKLSTCKPPLSLSQQPAGLLRVVNGLVANEKVNVDCAVELGEHALSKFKSSLPEGYYKPLTKSVVTMQEMKKSIKIDDKDIYI